MKLLADRSRVYKICFFQVDLKLFHLFNFTSLCRRGFGALSSTPWALICLINLFAWSCLFSTKKQTSRVSEPKKLFLITWSKELLRFYVHGILYKKCLSSTMVVNQDWVIYMFKFQKMNDQGLFLNFCQIIMVQFSWREKIKG